MSIAKTAAGAAFLVLGGWAAALAPAHAQQATYPAPVYAPGSTGYGTTPPGRAPGVWQMPAVGSNYAPNSSTGWAPYSQDYMNEVVHDGSNGGGRR